MIRLSFRLSFFAFSLATFFMAAALVRATDIPFDQVNQTFGASLFSATDLWDEDEKAVAARLCWPEESRTSTLASYRFYTTEKRGIHLLGCRAYSCALYAERGKPTEISLVFANKGDYNWIDKLKQEPPDDPDPFHPIPPDQQPKKPDDNPISGLDLSEVEDKPKISLDHAADQISNVWQNKDKNFADALAHDAKTIQQALTDLFGEPTQVSYGVTKEMSENDLRWDWRNESILLATPEKEYVSVRIIPKKDLDAEILGQATPNQLTDDQWKTMLQTNIVHEGNGDVKIEQIPMVDQGPKGFCVPATWQRVLRYMGMPADMYTMAMAAHTGGQDGRGTNVADMVNSAAPLVRKYKHKIILDRMNIKLLTESIDAGLPIIWSCDIYEPFDSKLKARQATRLKNTDWTAWGEQVKVWNQEVAQLALENTYGGGHQRLITGYNKATQELCISDSWGPEFQERWMTWVEAAKISEPPTVVIEP